MSTTTASNGTKAGEFLKMDVVVGEKVIEGKTKIVSTIKNQPDLVLVHSKDRITAGDGAKSHVMEGKAEISTKTAATIFGILKRAGIKSHFIGQHSATDFIARHCHMIPIEFVTRRVATGSFLKRNAGVKEGFRFNPPKLEYFYKDDANHDPQWCAEQILEAQMNCAGVTIGQTELDIMSKTTVAVFEILERLWKTRDCALIDMKIEFGIDVTTKEVILADIIDSDSWRLWPSGDRRLMKDKQVYRDMAEVTAEGLQTVMKNFTWIADQLQLIDAEPVGRVVVLMGSTADKETGEKIKETCNKLGVNCHIRVTSAHKGTDATLKILADYEGDGVATVLVAVAGRSNGLGPVLSGNATFPVINCPPLKAEWGPQDVWSSLRMPSGLGCSTVISAEAAALNAAQILALNDHMVWMRLRASQLNTWVDLRLADKKITGN
uniref:Uncharacterized protein paics n=1 Tax=Enchytraeus japonensis TaxID=228735 RepID=Q1MX38_9ANNE|nr:hypothetical protein similar to phosphoribosylaminoimidazole carboxylase [Enchytraeus japonensis]